jgi:hypothetical protein
MFKHTLALSENQPVKGENKTQPRDGEKIMME